MWNNSKTLMYVAAFFITMTMSSQSILGKWKTIDDETGKAKSIVNIYKGTDGKYYGKIEELLNKAEKDKKCVNCEGEDHNKPIQGMVIIKGLVQDGSEFEDGTITDPKNGKIYRCKIWVDEDDSKKLNVRGYIAFLFRTQQWIRM